MIPPFEADDNLPPGIHETDWDELVARFGGNEHRQVLIKGLRKALLALKRANCHSVYIDGSFVTAKETPRDYDACWEIEDIVPEALDPFLLEFDNTIYQKAKFRGELYPVDSRDESDEGDYLDLFQTDKVTGAAKGILKLDLRRFSDD